MQIMPTVIAFGRAPKRSMMNFPSPIIEQVSRKINPAVNNFCQAGLSL